MSTSSVLILIGALAGLLTLWRDEIVTPKVIKKLAETDEDKAKRLTDELKREKTKKIKLISSIFIFSSLIITFYQIHTTNVASKLQHAKDSLAFKLKHAEDYLAFKQLDSTYKNSIANGKAVNDIKKASQSILDSLDTVRAKVDAYSNQQINSLKQITSQTIDLLNPIPEHIVIAWSGKYEVLDDVALDWNEDLSKSNEISQHSNFVLDSNFFSKIHSFLDAFEPFNNLSVEFISNKLSVNYFGDFKNFELQTNGNDKYFNDNSKEFVYIQYDSSTKTILFEGNAKLKIGEASQMVKSLKTIENCSLIFRPNFINLFTEHKKAKINYFQIVSNKYRFEKYQALYDKKSEGFRISSVNILSRKFKE
jgi:hypothetical protein